MDEDVLKAISIAVIIAMEQGKEEVSTQSHNCELVALMRGRSMRSSANLDGA
jgi:hypothetical protein